MDLTFEILYTRARMEIENDRAQTVSAGPESESISWKYSDSIACQYLRPSPKFQFAPNASRNLHTKLDSMLVNEGTLHRG